MDYEKKYKDAMGMAEEIIRYYKEHNRGDETSIEDLEQIFPELKESEDEKIRKDCISIINAWADACRVEGDCCEVAPKCIAWLEKQESVEEIVARCKDSWYNEGKIVGMAEGLSDDEKYQQGWHDALEQGEQKPIMNVPTREVILSIWNLGNEWKELTNGSISTEYGTQLDYIQKHWYESEYYLREKQGEQKPAVVDFKAKNWYVSKVDGKIHDMTYNPTDKVEPKFKVKYAGSEYNVLEVKDIAGVTFYGIEDEPNHIDYVKAENCEIVSGYAIKENGSPYPTNPAVFSEQKSFDYESANIQQKDFAPKQESKKIKDEIEIPFGAKDSELQEETYYIPKGFHAEIDDDKVVIKKGEKSAAICICCNGRVSYQGSSIWIYKGDENTIQDRVQRVKKLITSPKKVAMYSKNGNYIKTFDSISQASKETDDSYIQIDRQIKTGIITKNIKHIWKRV